ncbi:hypothetical protein HYX12_01090 [Candidatus Woesearchaeota archaeon]|nr:hypothetical protein [Candidatus Woesearchaeota archaeon]
MMPVGLLLPIPILWTLFLDKDTNAIEVLPKDPDSVKIGDIISYNSPYGVIIHRVVEKGMDEHGQYFVVKGDNNTLSDPVKVRFNDLKGVVVAVIY